MFFLGHSVFTMFRANQPATTLAVFQQMMTPTLLDLQPVSEA